MKGKNLLAVVKCIATLYPRAFVCVCFKANQGLSFHNLPEITFMTHQGGPDPQFVKH